MRAVEFILEQGVVEARTNPDQNPKSESGMKELVAVAKTISDPENWAISMTGEPKLGINPQVGISEDTPKGIYFYPLNYAVDMARRQRPLPWGENMPYIQLFQYDRLGEMTKQTQVDSAQLRQAVGQYCSAEIMQQAAEEDEYDGTPYWYIYDCLSRLGKSDETNVVRWNKVLRDLGFTSVFDNGEGWIAHNEPTQGVVLDPRVIKQHKTISNRQQTRVVTPAVIEQAIFEAMDMELAANRAWQKYDPDGTKLRAAAKEYAKKPEFKQWFGKPGSEEIFDEASSWGRYGARQLGQKAWDWYKEQQAQQSVTETFDQPYSFRWEVGEFGDYDAYTKLPDGSNLSIMFNNDGVDDNAYSIEFWRNNSQEATGDGDAQRVFATVLRAIQEFLTKEQPNFISFIGAKGETGEEKNSRVNLYSKLLQRYATNWGYKLKNVFDRNDSVEFDLVKIKQVKIKQVKIKQGVAEGESNDTAISLSKLGKFHPGADTLAEFVPERATAQYALHPDKWESTFYSLTNKDSDKLKYYGPKKISIPPGTLVGDMAIANKFYRAKTPEEQEQYAELYKASLQPYPVDVSEYRMPELLIPKQDVAEGLDDNGISFQVQKGKNKFATTLSVGGDPVGVYQYDADTGRSIAEIYPEFKGKGLGKLLVLHAIYTAANLGLDFQEDESRTSEYDNVLDSLSSNGYIVDDDGYWYVTGQGEQYLQQSLKQGVAEGEDKSKDPIANAILDFYQQVGDIKKEPVDNYIGTAKEMLNQVSDPTIKSKLLDIFRQAKQSPYVQGGVVTTIGALLAGGVLSSAQKMGLSPAQTNLVLQAILNTVIPTVVSRINGKSWSDTVKYTLASAGIGTGIAGMMEE